MLHMWGIRITMGTAGTATHRSLKPPWSAEWALAHEIFFCTRINWILFLKFHSVFMVSCALAPPLWDLLFSLATRGCTLSLFVGFPFSPWHQHWTGGVSGPCPCVAHTLQLRHLSWKYKRAPLLSVIVLDSWPFPRIEGQFSFSIWMLWDHPSVPSD